MLQTVTPSYVVGTASDKTRTVDVSHCVMDRFAINRTLQPHGLY